MPFATNQGVRIHYRVEGDGRPLVIQHGFTGSLVTWYEQDMLMRSNIDTA